MPHPAVWDRASAGRLLGRLCPSPTTSTGKTPDNWGPHIFSPLMRPVGNPGPGTQCFHTLDVWRQWQKDSLWLSGWGKMLQLGADPPSPKACFSEPRGRGPPVHPWGSQTWVRDAQHPSPSSLICNMKIYLAWRGHLFSRLLSVSWLVCSGFWGRSPKSPVLGWETEVFEALGLDRRWERSLT